MRRVVLTSSFATIIDPGRTGRTIYETSWGDVTWEEAMDPREVYRGSKVVNPISVCIQDESRLNIYMGVCRSSLKKQPYPSSSSKPPPSTS